MNIVPIDQHIKYAPDHGIPNWTTLDPATAGSLIPAAGDGKAQSFVVSPRLVGATEGYASLDEALAGVSALNDPSLPSVGIVKAGDKFFGHEVWTYAQHTKPLLPSTRLSGSTITDYSPLAQAQAGSFGGFTTPYEGLAAIVSGALTLKPAATPQG